ncbi:uncharacterized protein LOC113591630 [Electrophorus electricus]|uniref:uncharacterized protein LOC113591630 n=1 Tax=Electrophorus electricus TaxID=8005 RepID=UPI0015D07D0A|nr:uncharacterized protein LOC113591630 [Electrophorus electricus]
MALSRIVLCIYTLAVVCEGCCAPVAQASLSFPNSLRLTRTLRARVQQLLQSYKEQQFGDRNFEDRRLILNTLPSVTINYRSWLQIQDMQRLYIASHNLRTFWEHLEAQRQKLELEGEEGREHQSQRRNKRARPQLSLAQSILIVQLDLRDLLKQVSFQVHTHTHLPSFLLFLVDHTHLVPYKIISETLMSSNFETLKSLNTTTHSGLLSAGVRELFTIPPTTIAKPLLNMKDSRGGTTSSSTQTPPPTSSFSSPTPRTPVNHALQSPNPSPTSSPTSHSRSASPASSSSPLADMRVGSPSHSALSMILTSTPWDMEVLNGRRSTSVHMEVTSSREETSQTSTIPLPRDRKRPVGKTTARGGSGSSRWVSRLEGYVILRDLELYLGRLARDYTLLSAKH